MIATSDTDTENCEETEQEYTRKCNFYNYIRTQGISVGCSRPRRGTGRPSLAFASPLFAHWKTLSTSCLSTILSISLPMLLRAPSPGDILAAPRNHACSPARGGVVSPRVVRQLARGGEQRLSERAFLARAQSTAEGSLAPSKDIDWDALGFNIDKVGGTMYLATCNASDGIWTGNLQPYGPLPVFPSAQVLNYGQSVFEGMKAQRSVQDDSIVLFRPDCNADRMRDGALRLSMIPPTKELFIEAVESTVRANASLVPPVGKGALYLRPLLMGTGPILGLGPAPSYTFCVYCAAVGAYFKGGQLTPIDLIVETLFHRAAPGGMGGTKCAGNYSPVLVTQLAAKKDGYADVVYLDAKSDTYLEEVSSCNIFVVKDKTIKTPPLGGTILPGVTRRSMIDLARSKGYRVEEAPVSVHEAMEADEIFTTGTAVVVSPVGSLTYEGRRKQFGTTGEPSPVALELYEALTGLQQERLEDPFGWVHHV